MTIFAYSNFIINNEIKVNCVHKIQNGKNCNSCGLTRGLNSFTKLEFSEASSYNSNSVFFGGLLIFQFISRFTIIIIDKIKALITSRKALLFEIILAVITFIILSRLKN